MKWFAAILFMWVIVWVHATPLEVQSNPLEVLSANHGIASKRGGNPSHCPSLPSGDGGAGFGCYNNKCWAYCGVGNQQSGQWCYTRQHDNEHWTGCRNDDECCPTYRCGGACSL